jgi:hypothetical protein
LKERETLFNVGRERFTRHPDAQNLARPFPYKIDAGVAQHTHRGNIRFPAHALRLDGHETAASAHLEEVVDDVPIPFTSEDFGCCRFQPEVAFLVSPGSAERHHGVERQCIGGGTAEFFSDECMFADRLIPLDTFACPPAHGGEALFEASHSGCGEREAADGEGGEGDSQTVIFVAEAVFNRHLHIVECRNTVIDAPDTLET